MESEKNCYASAMFGAEMVNVDGSWAWCMNPRLVATMAKMYWDAQRKHKSVTDGLARRMPIKLMDENAAHKYLKRVAKKRYGYEPYHKLTVAEWLDENGRKIREPDWVHGVIEAHKDELKEELLDHLCAAKEIIKHGFCDGCRGMGGSCMGCVYEDCGPDMVGALVKRSIALMGVTRPKGHEYEIAQCKAYVEEKRLRWGEFSPEIEFVAGSILDVRSLGVQGVAIFLPTGLTAFRWQAKDFVVKNCKLEDKKNGLEYLRCEGPESGALSRMVYDPNKGNRLYLKSEIEIELQNAMEYFETAGVESVAINGFRTAGDGAADTVEAVRFWAEHHARSCIRRIVLVDKRGDFERFKREDD